MNLKQIIKKVIAGEMPEAGEIEFLKNNSFEEHRFLAEIDRLEEVNAVLTREVESARSPAGQMQVKQSESELGSLRQLTKQLSEERDSAQKELKHWKYRQQIGELATQYHFSDVEYLAYLCEKNQIDLSAHDVAEGLRLSLKMPCSAAAGSATLSRVCKLWLHSRVKPTDRLREIPGPVFFIHQETEGIIMNDLMTAANEYFSLHLERNIWESLGQEEQLAALTNAVNDLTDYARVVLPVESEAVRRAICEQALWLVKRLRRKPQVVAESIEGLGSRSYAAGGDADDSEAVCKRSRLILSPVIQNQTGKLSRG